MFTKDEAADIAAVLRDRAFVCSAANRADRAVYYTRLADRLQESEQGQGEARAERRECS